MVVVVAWEKAETHKTHKSVQYESCVWNTLLLQSAGNLNRKGTAFAHF